MISNKTIKLILIFHLIYSFLFFILCIVFISKLSTKVKEYQNFKKEYIDENNLGIYNYNDNRNNNIKDFINLESNEKLSAFYRILIPIISIFFSLILYFLNKKPDISNNMNRKCFSRFCCCNFLIILDMILIFYEIIDSLVMINYRKKRIIPYITILINDSKEFESRVKTCKKIDEIFVYCLLIFLILFILLEINFYKKKQICCWKNESRNVNQIYNQQYLYNPNYNNNNIYNGNQQLAYPIRNISTGQYVIASNDNQNLNNNLNPNRIGLSFNNSNNNFNNENNTINNEENFLNKILNVCNRVNFDKNKYKGHEDCRICLMKFENEDKIIILPCLHIFHEHCLIDWLNNKKTCPLDNQSLENYI